MILTKIKTISSLKRLSFISLCAVTFENCQVKEERLPNFIIILADDLGYGDLGCYGATDIKTPNIDRIANEGIKFTAFYSASPVCSPSRAALLTGRYPQRMGVNNVFFPESFTGMPQSEITIAELLKKRKYITGIVGKWHLGHHQQYLPLQQGFDSYFGIPYSNDMSSVVYMRGNKVEEYDVDQKYITKRYTEESIQFIKQHKDNHFFLYLAHTMPHVPIYASEKFTGTSQRGLYGDVVQELDWSVGEIIKSLDELNILENTLVIFSSDNGPWLVMEDHGGSAGILREGKMYTFEGGMRVPTAAMWKGKIPEGIIYDDMACQMDLFPTFASIVGIPVNKTFSDGVDISKVLFNTGIRQDKSFLYFDGSELQCYRQGNWKIKKPYAGFEGSPWKNAVKEHDTLLFNLKTDPGEKENLYSNNNQLVDTLCNEMYKKYKSLGNLPPSLVVRQQPDNSHLEYLKSKNAK